MGGLCERRSEREGTVRRGGVRPSCMEATIVPYRPHIEVDKDEEEGDCLGVGRMWSHPPGDT